MGTAPIKKNTVTELEQVLAQEVELYRQYAASLKSDAELMTKLKIDELEKSNKSKNTLLLKIKAVDQARQNLVRQFAVAHGMPEDQIRIVNICEKVSSEEGKRLKSLADQLTIIVAELKTVHSNTAALANASLGWVNSSIATLHRLLSPTGTYNLQGKVERESHFTGRVVEKSV